MTASDRRKLEGLLSGWLDGDLNSEQMAELDEWLRTDADARKLHRRYAAMHVDLVEDRPVEVAVAAALDGLPEPEVLPAQYASMVLRLHVFQGIAVAMAVLCGAVGYMYATKTTRIERVEVLAPQPVVIIAEVIDAKDAIWADSRERYPGTMLQAETLSLASGAATVLFESGAVVHIEGPVELQVVSAMQATLNYGRVAARVPESARGFSIDAMNAAIVDLGTEFSMDVSREGVTQVFVFSGEVEAQLLDREGGTLRNTRVTANEGAEINGTGGTLTALDTTASAFLQIPRREADALTAEGAYATTIRAAQPMAYWRFDRADGRIVPNEMGTRYSGRLLGSAGLTDADRQSLLFPADRQGGFIVDEMLEDINEGPFSIELWVNPGALEHMSLVSIVDPEPVPGKGHKHLAYLELTGTPYAHRHQKYDVRFLHRYPASGGFGTNTFAGISYRPGNWYHIAGVREADKLILYVNGEKRREVPVGDGMDDAAYQLFVGQIDPARMERGFTGQIDELAVYNRAMTAEEVLQHYNAIGK